MATANTLARNAKQELAEMGARAEEALHRVWPFRRQEDAEDTARETTSFPVDIYETEDAFVVVAEMPGVTRDGITVRISENELTISGRFEFALDKDEDVLYREIPGADYRRTFTLSDAVDREKITAELKNGVLTVTLAKSDRVKPRTIEIMS